jgi:hypothetical protein
MLLKEEEKEGRIKRQRMGGSALPSLSWSWLERVERKVREGKRKKNKEKEEEKEQEGRL